MKTLKLTLLALAFAAILAFAFSGCESTGSGTHNMGNAKKPHMMSDRDMPGR